MFPLVSHNTYISSFIWTIVEVCFSVVRQGIKLVLVTYQPKTHPNGHNHTHEEKKNRQPKGFSIHITFQSASLGRRSHTVQHGFCFLSILFPYSVSLCVVPLLDCTNSIHDCTSRHSCQALRTKLNTKVSGFNTIACCAFLTFNKNREP